MNGFLGLLLALLPILWLIFALSFLKLSGAKSCLGALIISFVLAVFLWDMPLSHAFSATLEGFIFALWPIILVIIAAIFTYNITLKTGAMSEIQEMIGAVTMDKRLLTIIIGFAFGGFMEGVAGFGTAVAIPASMLVVLGISPMEAIVACLVSNSMPTAFGSIGIPTISLAGITGLEATKLSLLTISLQSILTLSLPFIMILIVGGSKKALKDIWHIPLFTGLAFLIPQFLVAKFIGPELVVVVGSIFALLVSIYLSKKESSKNTTSEYQIKDNEKKKLSITKKDFLVTWSPYILIFLFLLTTSKIFPFIHNPLGNIKSSLSVYQGENPATLTFQWLISPGVLILLAGFIGGKIQGLSIKELFGILLDSLKQMIVTIITIMSVLATAKIMGYSGMITSIANSLVSMTGSFYPIIAPLIGALGAFVTGSGTSANVLFGNLQVEASHSLGLNPYILASINTLGACIGKIISPQTIAIGASTTGLVGKEGDILSRTIKWSFYMLVIASILSITINMLL